jgi:hypothetical protein
MPTKFESRPFSGKRILNAEYQSRRRKRQAEKSGIEINHVGHPTFISPEQMHVLFATILAYLAQGIFQTVRWFLDEVSFLYLLR